MKASKTGLVQEPQLPPTQRLVLGQISTNNFRPFVNGRDANTPQDKSNRVSRSQAHTQTSPSTLADGRT